MEEYIKTLLEQVRCKKAHALIEGEIRGHMEEQVEANLAEGMPEEEAVGFPMEWFQMSAAAIY